MKFKTSLLCAVLLSLVVAPAFAATTSQFVVRLGNDTTSVERFARDGNRVTIDQVGRAPRVLSRHVEYDYAADGALRGMTVTVTNPGAPAGAPPTQRLTVTMKPDSLILVVRRDTTTQTTRLPAPPGTMVVSWSTPWGMIESFTMRVASLKRDRMEVPLYLLGGAGVDTMKARRVAPDTIDVENVEGIYRAHVDAAGRILGITPIRGTAQYNVSRQDGLDLAATTAMFLAREKAAGAMGALSTRDTVVANAGGASLWIDYGRPSKRGRVVFGGVVPYGELWRTGANSATQFRTDKALEMGGHSIPAGMYTLWTVPAPGTWKLTFNSETGQWGTDHHAEKDLFTVAMPVSALGTSVERFTISVTPSASGGRLNFDWDTTRASVPFNLKP